MSRTAGAGRWRSSALLLLYATRCEPFAGFFGFMWIEEEATTAIPSVCPHRCCVWFSLRPSFCSLNNDVISCINKLPNR